MSIEFKLSNERICLVLEAAGGVYNDAQLEVVFKLAQDNGGITKVSEDQRLLIFAPADSRESIEASAKEVGLGIRDYRAGLHQPVSCLGKNCPHAQQPADELALQISEELRDLQVSGSLRIGINGCQTACVPIQTLDVALMATPEGYTVSVGGKNEHVAEFASFMAEGVPGDEVVGKVRGIIETFQAKAEEGEALCDVIERIGSAPFVTCLEPYSQDAAGEGDVFGAGPIMEEDESSELVSEGVSVSESEEAEASGGIDINPSAVGESSVGELNDDLNVAENGAETQGEGAVDLSPSADGETEEVEEDEGMLTSESEAVEDDEGGDEGMLTSESEAVEDDEGGDEGMLTSESEAVEEDEGGDEGMLTSESEAVEDDEGGDEGMLTSESEAVEEDEGGDEGMLTSESEAVEEDEGGDEGMLTSESEAVEEDEGGDEGMLTSESEAVEEDEGGDEGMLTSESEAVEEDEGGDEGMLTSEAEEVEDDEGGDEGMLTSESEAVEEDEGGDEGMLTSESEEVEEETEPEAAGLADIHDEESFDEEGDGPGEAASAAHEQAAAMGAADLEVQEQTVAAESKQPDKEEDGAMAASTSNLWNLNGFKVEAGDLVLSFESGAQLRFSTEGAESNKPKLFAVGDKKIKFVANPKGYQITMDGISLTIPKSA